MAIQKKSLISTLKSAKKAKVASAKIAEVESGKTQKNLARNLTKASPARVMARFVRFARVD